jgi:hypothetical protein
MSGSGPRGDRAGGAAPAPSTPGVEGSAGAGRVARARRRGRTAAMVGYYGLAAVMSIATTVQLTRQIFLAPVPPSPWPSCRAGLLALADAVDRARSAASGNDGEDAALEGFRRALEPEWGYRDSVAAACRGADSDEGALDAIERLRYAEEHAVRHEAGDLAPLRRRVQTIVQTELRPGKPQDRP